MRIFRSSLICFVHGQDFSFTPLKCISDTEPCQIKRELVPKTFQELGAAANCFHEDIGLARTYDAKNT